MCLAFVNSSVNLYSQVANSEIGEKPVVDVGDDPKYNPSNQDNSNITIPSSDDKPSVLPTENSPTNPDQTNIPFGKPGNIHYYDRTKYESSSGTPSTAKLELLENQSDLDAEKVLNLKSDELLEIEDIISSYGSSSITAKYAVEMASRINGMSNVDEGRGKKVLKLITEKTIDSERLYNLQDKSLVLTSKLLIDDVMESGNVLNLVEAAETANLDIDKLDDFVSVEFLDTTSSTTLRSNLIKNFGEAASKNAVNFNDKADKILAMSDVVNLKSKNLIFEKLSNASSGANPIAQLLLLDSAVLDNIASIEKSPDDLASSALDSLKSSAFASELNFNSESISSSDINSVFNYYDNLKSISTAVDANFENVREQIASIIILDVVSDAFQIGIINDDGAKTSVQAPLQFSDISDNYGAKVLAEIESLTSSAAIVEEMNELNPSLFASHVQDNTNFDHHELIIDILNKNGRRTSVSESTSALTLIKEFQRDTIIDEVLKEFSSILPVNKEAIQKILTPGNEDEEHHHEKAMNSGSHIEFAHYIDDIVPDELVDSVRSTGQASFSNQITNLKSRLSTVRMASMGYPSSDNLIDAMVAMSMNEMEQKDLYLAQANGSLTKDIIQKVLYNDNDDYLNGFYVQASASFTEDKLHQMDGDSWGLTFGVDQEIVQGFTFGIMGGFGESDSSGAGTNVDTDSYFAGIYGNKVNDEMYVEGFLTFGFHESYNLRRENSGALLESSPRSEQITIGLTYGQIVEFNGFLITPSIGFTYDNFNTDSYFEKIKSDPLGLAGASQMLDRRDESLISSIGTKVNYYHFLPEGGALIPELRLSWEHDFKSNSVGQAVHLLSHGPDDTYYINGRRKDSDFGFIGTGITSIDKSGLSAHLNYDYLLGKSQFDAHFLNFGIRFKF